MTYKPENIYSPIELKAILESPNYESYVKRYFDEACPICENGDRQTRSCPAEFYYVRQLLIKTKTKSLTKLCDSCACQGSQYPGVPLGLLGHNDLLTQVKCDLDEDGKCEYVSRPKYYESATSLYHKNIKLKEQIERMKNCMNCNHSSYCTDGDTDVRASCLKWEMNLYPDCPQGNLGHSDLPKEVL
jgi:hypothetical protein